MAGAARLGAGVGRLSPLRFSPMPRTTLTLGQSRLIIAIRNHQHLHGYTPSVRELAQLCGRAKGTVFQQLQSLTRRGILRRHPRTARAIEILPPR